MNIVTKDFPVTLSDTESPTGSFEVILSAPTLDRDKEIIDPKAFEPLPDHITFDTDHSMTVDSVVGSGIPYYAVDGTLRVKGTFASDARSQTVRQKIAEGHIRTTSVTFLDAEREADEKGVPHIKRAELLNGTFTPVPSNREAVVLTAKSIVLKQGARNSAADQALVQQIHDLAVALGAMCDGEPDADDTGKAVTDADEKTTSDEPSNEDPSDSPAEDAKTLDTLAGARATEAEIKKMAQAIGRTAANRIYETLDETETKSAAPTEEPTADEAAASSAAVTDDEKSVPLSRVALLEHALEL